MTRHFTALSLVLCLCSAASAGASTPAPTTEGGASNQSCPLLGTSEAELRATFAPLDAALAARLPDFRGSFADAVVARQVTVRRLVTRQLANSARFLDATNRALDDEDYSALDRLGRFEAGVDPGVAIRGSCAFAALVLSVAPTDDAAGAGIPGLIAKSTPAQLETLGLREGVHYTREGDQTTVPDEGGAWQGMHDAFVADTARIQRALDLLEAHNERVLSDQSGSAAAAAEPEREPVREAPPAAKQERDSWYIGFTLGSGPNGLTLGGRDITYDEHARAAGAEGGPGYDIGFSFQVGATLSPHWLIGFEGSAMSRQATGYILQHNQYLAAATFFPMADGKGFFLKGALGLSIMSHRDDGFGLDVRATGTGGALGLGYALWLGDAFNLTLSSDVHVGRYGAPDEFPVESGYYNLTAIGFMWY